ncbi:MAG: potassium-transporting ATPase subunit KdpC [Dehalococcoidia bacterium]|nr:potassium-transporting ATPase subunit KdpC [Dehalococcoidia bacterium]
MTAKALTQELRPLLGITVTMLLLTTAVYPLAVTGVAQTLFHRQANGSIVEVNGSPVGSTLIGQMFEGDQYFHGRPSAAGDGYDASASGGSNLGPTSQKLIDRVTEDAAAFRQSNSLEAHATLPSDAVTASGSGLDPHVSPATARLQVERVAHARRVTEDQVRELVDEFTEGRQLVLIGEPRVNVLKLNIALDERFPLP